jgi:hypothetical protein
MYLQELGVTCSDMAYVSLSAKAVHMSFFLYHQDQENISKKSVQPYNLCSFPAN